MRTLQHPSMRLCTTQNTEVVLYKQDQEFQSAYDHVFPETATHEDIYGVLQGTPTMFSADQHSCWSALPLADAAAGCAGWRRGCARCNGWLQHHRLCLVSPHKQCMCTPVPTSTLVGLSTTLSLLAYTQWPDRNRQDLHHDGRMTVCVPLSYLAGCSYRAYLAHTWRIPGATKPSASNPEPWALGAGPPAGHGACGVLVPPRQAITPITLPPCWPPPRATTATM